MQWKSVQHNSKRVKVLIDPASSMACLLLCHSCNIVFSCPTAAAARGMPRVNAKAKDSEWVRQRQALETAKPADVNEVILVSHDGALTEGLTSNFFVLSDKGEVVTAQEGVLDGTVRQVILQVGDLQLQSGLLLGRCALE